MNPPPAIDPRALLAHEPFLRELARSLLYDSNAAADAVQHAWMRALEAPPRDSARLRAWLAAVVRNFAKENIRKNSRRMKRELLAAKTEALPSVEEYMERESHRQALVRAVLALEEPGRSVILWRFFEGKSPREIAQALGVPPATVRNRIHRTLVQLRARLTIEYKDQASWCNAITTLAGGLGASKLQFMVRIMETSLFVMTRKTITTVAAALLLAFAGLLTWPVLFRGNEIPPEISPVPAREVSLAETHEARADKSNITESRRSVETTNILESSREVAARYLAGFRGRVARPDGSPAANCKVRVLELDPSLALVDDIDWSGTGPRRPIAHRYDTIADGAGEFTIRGVRPGGRHLILAAPGAAEAFTQILPRSPESGETVDLGLLILQMKGVIRGRVTGPDGAAVAGARVRSIHQGSGPVTQAFHNFRIDLLDTRGYFVVEQAIGEKVNYQVVRVPAWVGELVDSLELPDAQTGPDGTFTVTGLEDAANMVFATKPGFLSAFRTPVSVKMGTVADIGEIQLKTGETARGRVIDSNGQPIAGAEVVAGPTSFEQYGKSNIHIVSPAGHTGKDGSFELRGLTGRDVIVAARRSTSEGWIAAGPQKYNSELIVQFPAQTSLRVIFAGAPPEAAAHASLRLVPGIAAGEWLASGFFTSLNGEWKYEGGSSFIKNNIPVGQYTILAAVPGFALVVQPAAANGTDITIPLTRAGEAEVEVFVGTGERLNGVLVTATPATPPDWTASVLPKGFSWPHWASLPVASGRTGADGRLALRALPWGTVNLHLHHPGFCDADLTLQIPAGRTAVTLAPGPVLELELRKAGENLREEQTLIIETVEAGPSTTGAPREYPVQTNAEGRARVMNLQPGKYIIYESSQPGATSPLASLNAFIQRSRITQQPVTPFVLEAGRTTQLVHEESHEAAAPNEETLAIRGTVTINDKPVGGGVVTVRMYDRSRGPGRYPGTSVNVGSDGQFRFERLRVPSERGNVILSFAETEGGQLLWTRSKEKLVAPESIININITMGELEGRVLGLDQQPKECNVYLDGHSADGGVIGRDAHAAADGTFKVSNLVTGDYQIQAVSRYGTFTNSNIKIQKGMNRVELRILPPARVSGGLDASSLGAGPDDAVWVMFFSKPMILNLYPSALMNADGTFEMSGLDARDYDIHVKVGDRWFRNSEIIPLRGENLGGLTLHLEPAGAPEFPLPNFPAKKSEVKNQSGKPQFSTGYAPPK